MTTLLIVLVILILVFGGGGFYTTRPSYVGPGAGFGHLLYILAGVLILVLALNLLGVV